MEVKVHAILRNLRMSDKKVRLVADAIRGLSVSAAEAQLKGMEKAGRFPVAKLLASAVANATHNFKAAKETLRVAAIMVDKAPMLYRYMPRARGSAAPIRRHMCHVKIVLAGTAPDEAPKAPAETKESATS